MLVVDGQRLERVVALPVTVRILAVRARAAGALLAPIGLAELLRGALLPIRLLAIRLLRARRLLPRRTWRLVLLLSVPCLVWTRMPTLVLHSTPDSFVRTKENSSTMLKETRMHMREAIMTPELAGYGRGGVIYEGFAVMNAKPSYIKRGEASMRRFAWRKPMTDIGYFAKRL